MVQYERNGHLGTQSARPGTRKLSAGLVYKAGQRAALDHGNRERKSTDRKSKYKNSKSRNRKFKGGIIGASLARLKDEYKRHYYFSDDNVIDVVLAVVASNHFDSDPIWLHLISPPSGGKTELLNSIFECEQTYFLSDFTAAALISGYRNPDDEGDDQEDYSLLPKLDGKVVVTKDFSLIHDKPAETRAQILSMLRDAYDGYASRGFGNSETKGYHARFNYLTGMTPDIEKSWSLNTLGERFLMYRIQIEDRREHARQSLRNANKVESIRKPLQQSVKQFIDSIPRNVVPMVDEEMEDRILDLADLLSTCRTYVHRERNDEMPFLPLPELASRVAKQLLRIGQGAALVRGKDHVTHAEFEEIMKRIALDSLPTNRRHLIKALWDHRDSSEPVETFEKATGLAKTTTRRGITDLRALGVVTEVKRREAGKSNKTTRSYYQLSDNIRQSCTNVGGV